MPLKSVHTKIDYKYKRKLGEWTHSTCVCEVKQQKTNTGVSFHHFLDLFKGNSSGQRGPPKKNC